MMTDARVLRQDGERPGELSGVAGVIGPSIGRLRRYLHRVRIGIVGSPPAKDGGDVLMRPCPECDRTRSDGGAR